MNIGCQAVKCIFVSTLKRKWATWNAKQENFWDHYYTARLVQNPDFTTATKLQASYDLMDQRKTKAQNSAFHPLKMRYN